MRKLVRMPKLIVIIGSTRPGRAGLPVAQWFHDRAVKHGGFDVELVDLAEENLPMLDAPHHPRLANYPHQHTEDWSAKIASADAYAFVIPEYNHAITAPVKNAIDYLNREWHHKAIGIVSYGGIAAGTRAAQQLRQVMLALKAVPLLDAVHVPFVAQFIKDGEFVPNDVLETSATTLLDERVRYTGALSQLRD